MKKTTLLVLGSDSKLWNKINFNIIQSYNSIINVDIKNYNRRNIIHCDLEQKITLNINPRKQYDVLIIAGYVIGDKKVHNNLAITKKTTQFLETINTKKIIFFSSALVNIYLELKNEKKPIVKYMRYAKQKFLCENYIKKRLPNAIFLRIPMVIFDNRGGVYNTFKILSKFLPIINIFETNKFFPFCEPKYLEHKIISALSAQSKHLTIECWKAKDNNFGKFLLKAFKNQKIYTFNFPVFRKLLFYLCKKTKWPFDPEQLAIIV